MVGMSWRLVRGRGAAPLSFFVCASLSVAIAILGKTQAPVVEEARAKLSDLASPALTETRAPLVAFERWTTGLTTLFGVYAENIHLRQENAELKKWQNVALTLEDRVRRYELLLNAAPCGLKIPPLAVSRSARSMPALRGIAPTSSATSTSPKATSASSVVTTPASNGKAQSSSSILTPSSAFSAGVISSNCRITGVSGPSIEPEAMRNRRE